MSKFDGYFKDWVISDYRANHKDGRVISVSNGFLFFRSESHVKASINAFNMLDRYRLWRELKAEVRRRQI
jgi:hypothetical protein